MAAILQTIYSDAYIQSPIDNTPALVYIMAWRRIGDKALSEPMLTRIYGVVEGDEL